MSAISHASPAQRERLVLLMEECAEVQQVCAKILRHGWRVGEPEAGGWCNRIGLEHELGDLLWAVDLLEQADDVSGASVARFQEEKPERAREWLHFQGNSGCVRD